VGYEVIWQREAKEDLKKIGDREIAEKIESQAEKALTSNPFSNGKPLTGNWGGRWSYRIDYHDIKIYSTKKKPTKNTK
jgi:mRNA-degrading endonuclease RelE of RelBE toxin-antitoxin system